MRAGEARRSARGCTARWPSTVRCASASTRTRGLLAAWGLPETVQGLETFAMTCVEAFAGTVAAVKPQSAFFERFGSAGVAVLERALAGLRDAGTLSLLDVKRGDIGSTMTAYAQAYLGDDSPLRADAITVSPYLGYGSLRPALDLARDTGRGVFVLALTSNPEGAVGAACPARRRERRRARSWPAPPPTTRAPPRWAASGSSSAPRSAPRSSDLGLDLAAVNGPLLAPGIGAQGAGAEDLRAVFGAALPAVLASSSREVLGAGPDAAAAAPGGAATPPAGWPRSPPGTLTVGGGWVGRRRTPWRPDRGDAASSRCCRPARTAGQSSATTENIAVSRTVPSARRW